MLRKWSFLTIEGLRFKIIEVQIIGILNIEVFKQNSKGNVNHQVSSSFGDKTCRSRPFKIQKLWLENFEY